MVCRTASLRVVCLAAMLVLLVVAGCAAAVGTETVWLDGNAVSVTVAQDDAARSQGLQGHDPLAADEGMLFVWVEPEVRTFSMKSVSFPIEVVFVDENLVVSAIHRLEPGDLEAVTSPSPSRWVLEMSAGWASSHGVEVGSSFRPPE